MIFRFDGKCTDLVHCVQATVKIICGSQDRCNYCTNIFQEINFADIWRQFVGNGIDLQQQTVINWMESKGNSKQSELLVDGDRATCLSLNQTSCVAALKVVHVLSI